MFRAQDGTRLLTKYFEAPHPPANAASSGLSYPGSNPYPTVKEQKAFEKGLLEKTNKTSNDVILYDNRMSVVHQSSEISLLMVRSVVYKMEGDIMMYVVGGAEENEIMLFSVVLALRDSLAILLK